MRAGENVRVLGEGGYISRRFLQLSCRALENELGRPDHQRLCDSSLTLWLLMNLRRLSSAYCAILEENSKRLNPRYCIGWPGRKLQVIKRICHNSNTARTSRQELYLLGSCDASSQLLPLFQRIKSFGPCINAHASTNVLQLLPFRENSLLCALLTSARDGRQGHMSYNIHTRALD